MIPTMIQAGGRGARLRPFTTILPKPLMPIGEMPVIEIVIRQLKNRGFENLYISVSHLGHLLQAVLGDGSKWGVDIKYVFEDKPLGTIGPVRRMPRPDVPFLVMNGDLLTNINYADLYQHHLQADVQLTVGVYQCTVPVSLGVLELGSDNSIMGFREKPSLHYWASMGVYVFSPELWDIVPPNEHYGFDTLMEEVLRGTLRAQVYRFEGIWLDIGRPEDYERAAEVFEQSRDELLPQPT